MLNHGKKSQSLGKLTTVSVRLRDILVPVLLISSEIVTRMEKLARLLEEKSSPISRTLRRFSIGTAQFPFQISLSLHRAHLKAL
jgi:hypothetical protein